MQTKHTFKHWQWRVIICSMIGYSMFYFVRKNFSFAMPALGEAYGITNTSFGIILSLVGIIYGISKFINGFIADRANARWHLVIGLTICALLNYIFGFSADLSHWITGASQGPDFVNSMVVIMAVLLVLNNIFQGCGFSPCNRLMVHWVPPKELATKMSFWNTSHSIGAGLVSVLCGYIIGSGMGSGTGTMAWQWCFWIPAVIASLGVFFILVSLRDTPTSVGLPELPDTKTELDEDDSPEAFKAFIRKKVFQNPIVWILALTDLFVYIVRFAVLDWGPTFLQNRAIPLSPQLAGWTIAIFEIAGCAGMMCAGWVSDRFFGGKAQRVCAIEMGIVALCLVALHLLPADASSVLVLVLLAVAGFFLYGPQALLGVVAANQVTKKAASSAVGLIGLMSYVSVIFTGAGLGWFSDHFGWDYLFILMSGVAIVGGLTVALLWNIKDDGYIH
ncbi:MAG: MFS transporter [Bacteroidaceae bacterium]|jgi:OPA family glycerol-3-phosphate transporter-like MFS transporter/OPA family sugar phosphate sensor protein UhpC-like MFS transporter|nr:MFS transporter [Bacteroidaceae bacterium]MBQ6049633.1 MFS transporter [Bacteroidaceae bacterium]MBR3546446.1 MFS transporter [Bacteroidaceae bacterium]MBR4527966.1 MFS transporter [Bacteroidaceae bacterium]